MQTNHRPRRAAGRRGARALAVSAALGPALLLGTATAPAAPVRHGERPPLTGMRVLLSNDDSMRAARPDGADGRGLYEMRKALCAAGADVVVLAPWQYMSGAGTSVSNSGAFAAQRRTRLPARYAGDCSGAPTRGAVFGLCRTAGTPSCTDTAPSATPADTVRFALRGGLRALTGWTAPPDAVVTGINSGPNVSSQVNDSGTAGAALAAVDERVPAVAFSAWIADGSTLPSDTTYRAAARYGASLLGRLRAHRLLSPTHVLNVNYPDTSGGSQPAGERWTRVGDGTVAVHTYRRAADGTFTVGGALCPQAPGCRGETREDADSTAVAAGHVSLSALTPDRTAPADAETARLRAYLGGHHS
ncbi:5'/3'-nucleotidase SurE [Streptomyces sp. NPDC028635]|uniref:5'/3'-nucleotidase SurE n=1 Tax=Streptomyces sp. NPDC028635 TaxID=3154800 RepID=UPI0033F04024